MWPEAIDSGVVAVYQGVELFEWMDAYTHMYTHKHTTQGQHDWTLAEDMAAEKQIFGENSDADEPTAGGREHRPIFINDK